MIKFDCPNCSKTLRCKPTQAGRTAKCPGCGDRITVPRLARTDNGDGEVPAAASSTYGRRCPNCDAVLSLQDVVCVLCGTNVTTGKTVQEEAEEKRKIDRLQIAPELKEMRKALNSAGFTSLVMGVLNTFVLLANAGNVVWHNWLVFLVSAAMIVEAAVLLGRRVPWLFLWEAGIFASLSVANLTGCLVADWSPFIAGPLAAVQVLMAIVSCFTYRRYNIAWQSALATREEEPPNDALALEASLGGITFAEWREGVKRPTLWLLAAWPLFFFTWAWRYWTYPLSRKKRLSSGIIQACGVAYYLLALLIPFFLFGAGLLIVVGPERNTPLAGKLISGGVFLVLAVLPYFGMRRMGTFLKEKLGSSWRSRMNAQVWEFVKEWWWLILVVKYFVIMQSQIH